MKKMINLLLIAMLVLIPIKSMATDTGHSKTVQITAKPGYQVTDVIVNGESKGPLTSYTFSDVLSPQSLEVITQPIGYTVTFNANGGKGTMEDQVFNKISGKLNANTFTKEGYAFNGWSTTSNGVVEYEDEDICFLLEDKTLYAVWGLYGDVDNDGEVTISDKYELETYIWEIGYEINLNNADVNCDGFINEIDYALINEACDGNVVLPFYGKCVVVDGTLLARSDVDKGFVLPTTNPAGHKVKFWYTDPITKERFNAKTSMNWVENVIFYSELFGDGDSVVAFTPSGGSGSAMPQLFTSEKAEKLYKNPFVKEGYVFKGWSTTADGEVEYKDEEVCYFLQSLSLYAVWGLYGDVTGDGVFDDGDLLRISKYVSGQNVEVDESVADVNLDGKINLLDSALISQALSGQVTLPYTGIGVYNDAGLLQKSDASFEYTIVARTDDNNGDLLGYFVNEWGGQYVKVGDTITINSNTELLPVWSEVLASGGSSVPTYTVTVSSISNRTIMIGGTEVTSSGTYEVAVGTPIYALSATSGDYVLQIKVNGKTVSDGGVGQTSGFVCSVFTDLTISVTQARVNVTI